MGIQLANAEIAPTLVYDRVFMENLSISQQSENDNSASPTYELSITYRIYAVGGDGMRHFRSKVQTVMLPDYLAVAYARAQQGDMDLLAAMQAIEVALAKILEDQTDIGETSII